VGAIQDQDLVLEETRLRNEGTDPARTEQPSQDGDEMDKKNGQIAHQRIVAGRRILRNLGRNNNSPATPFLCSFNLPLLRQLDLSQPEAVDDLHQRLELAQLHWLAQIAVCMKLVALYDIRFEV
jgi:hypothetical protein